MVLRDLAQEIALVLVAIYTGEQLVRPVIQGVSAAVMACGHSIGTELVGGIAEEVEFDFPVAQDIRVGRAPCSIFLKHVVYDALAVRIGQVDDLKRNAQVLRHKQGVIGIVYPRTGIVQCH